MKDDRRRAWIVFALLFTSFAYFYQGAGPNQYSRFDLVRAIVDKRTLVIDDYAKNTIDKAEADGHFYSDKAPGLALASAPVYFVVRCFQGFATPTRDSARFALYFITVIVVGGASALAGVFVFRLQRRLGVAPLPAAIAVVAYALGSNHFAYATLYVGHAFVAALLVIAFALLQERRRIALAGFLVGWAAISEYPAGAMALFLAIYAAKREDRRALTRFAIAAAIPLIVLAAYDTSCFGAPWTLGYDRLPSETYREAMSHGFYGVALPSPAVMWRLLFGDRRGIVPLAPWIVLAIAGLVLFRRRHRLEFFVASACIAFPFLLASSYAVWDGGMAMGPRHFVVALPFLGISLGFLLDQLFSLPRRRIVAPLIATSIGLVWSLALCLACVAVMPELPDTTIPIRVDGMSAPDPDHPITTLVLPLLKRGYVSVKGTTPTGHIGYAIGFEGHDDDAINLGERVGLRGPWSLLPLLASWIAAAVALVRARTAGGAKSTEIDPSAAR